MSAPCTYCHNARLVGWSGAGPILCSKCSHGKDTLDVITQAWREQKMRADELAAELAEAREALGEGWLAGGATLAEGIRRKTAKLEELFDTCSEEPKR